MTAPTPTGRHERRGTDDHLVWERTLRAPIDDVWASVTESDRLARWFGTWTGDPADGFVTVQMNAEGDAAEPSRFEIRACDAPTHLAVDVVDEGGAWYLDLELRESDGTTTLLLAQRIHDVSIVEDTGPGWEWYLDRLVSSASGADTDDLDFDAYLAATHDHYRALQETLTPDNPR